DRRGSLRSGGARALSSRLLLPVSSQAGVRLAARGARQRDHQAPFAGSEADSAGPGQPIEGIRPLLFRRPDSVATACVSALSELLGRSSSSHGPVKRGPARVTSTALRARGELAAGDARRS